MKSYVSYKVNTETSIAAFDSKRFSVIRRYSDFEWLRLALQQNLPGVIVPPLPEKAVMNRFSPEFIEGRRRSLERFISRCAEHPFIREDPTFRIFIDVDDMAFTNAKTAKKSTGWSAASVVSAASALTMTGSAAERTKRYCCLTFVFK